MCKKRQVKLLINNTNNYERDYSSKNTCAIYFQ